MEELEENKCLKCPVRGTCCYLSGTIGGHNVIFTNQPCEFLNRETGLCTIYDKRKEVKHCKTGNDIFNCGSLPEGCLLLNGKKEENMKVLITKIASELSQQDIMIYNLMNNNPHAWEIYKEECI